MTTRALNRWTIWALLLLGGCSSPTRDALSQIQDQPIDPDLEELRKTDPKLILYDKVGAVETGFKVARGIALGPRGLYVVGDSAIRLFDANGKLIAETPLSGEPQCVASNDEGRVFVGFRDHVVSMSGDQQVRWPSLGDRALITSLAVAADSVYVGDSGNRLVVRYGFDGQIIGSFGKRDPATGYAGLILPSPHLDVAVRQDGKVLVTNPGTHRVETRTAEGKIQSSWGEADMGPAGFSGCCNPTDIALLPDGSVATSEKGLPRVKVYGPKGEFVGVVAGADTFAEQAVGLDLAVGEDRVFVLDPVARTVRVYAKKAGAQR